MNSILKELGINNVNYGACSGSKKWSSSQDGGVLESINPSTGEVIASVYQATENNYEQIVKESHPLEGNLCAKWETHFGKRRMRWVAWLPWRWVKLKRKVMVKFRK